MADAAAAVLEAARASGLLPAGHPVLVLLSGGRDSTCLLDVAVRLAGGEAVAALHVDHGLRPESGADAEHCRRLCADLGVPLAVERAPAPPEPGNLQAWARDVRYAAAERHAAGRDAVVAVGHTASDQAETVLYRLAVSPGRRALLGMPAREGRLVRPLLAVSREQTASYCRARGMQWRDDPSNQDPRFARARVRHELLAALRSLHPAAEANVVRTAQVLAEEAEVLDGLVADALAGAASIPQERLAALPDALARLVVRRLAEDATGGLCPRAAARLPELLALREGALDLGDGARAEVRGGVLRMARTPPLPEGGDAP